jgi:hypothetical protein
MVTTTTQPAGAAMKPERRATDRAAPPAVRANRSAAPPWRVAGRSVRGASHVRAGLPNQDALSLWSSPAGDPLPCAAAAVADGHGGQRHFRSQIGARIAVEVAIGRLRALAAGLERCAPAERASHVAAHGPAAIVGEWAVSVQADLAEHPIRDDEWAVLAEAEGEDGVDAVRADPLLAYGATLLAALVTPSAIVLLQLGDGDVLCVAGDGSTRRPIAHDERLAGNRTTSICQPDAESDMRLAVLHRDQDDAILLLLSTDGYANSFRSDDDFLCIGDDFRSLIAKHGLTAVDAQLETILLDASAQGSGDDITLALLHSGAARDATGAGLPLAATVADPRPSGPPPFDGAQRQIRRLRLALGTALLGIAALAGWLLFPDWHRHVWPAPAAPGGHPPAVVATPLRDPGLAVPDPAEPGAKPTATSGKPTIELPAQTPTTTPKGGSADADTGAAGMLEIQHPRAARTERGIQVSAALSAAPGGGACTVRAAVWGGGDKELGAASAPWSAATAEPALMLLVPYPGDKARAKQMHGASEFSLRVDCGGRTLGKTERIAIDA